MVVVAGSPLYPPEIWIRSREQALTVPLFQLCPRVEVYQQGRFVVSEAARLALAKDWHAGKEDDSTSISGRLRLTLPERVPAGPLVFLARGRGKLAQFTADGGSAQASWLGLDAAPPDATHAAKPRGWHPIAFRHIGGPTVELITGPLRLSLLAVRTTGEI